jgi:hypothetical protein
MEDLAAPVVWEIQTKTNSSASSSSKKNRIVWKASGKIFLFGESATECLCRCGGWLDYSVSSLQEKKWIKM